MLVAPSSLAVVLIVSLVLWNVPYGGGLLYPFKLLATWFHEISHALMMLVSGTGLDRVEIYSDTSGITFARERAGPVALAFILPAGYMGTPLWGAALLVAARTARGARRGLVALALALGITAVAVIAAPNGDNFGKIAIATIASVCLIGGLALPAAWVIAMARFVAAQACVNALLDIRVLARPNQVLDGIETPVRSDADGMALVTFGTNDRWAVWIWIGVWLAWSLLLTYLALRYCRRTTRIESSSPAKNSGAASTIDSGA